MLYTCVARFDVMENLKNFAKLFETKQDLRILKCRNILNLTKIIKNTKIYDIKLIYYENIVKEEPDNT